MHAVFLPLALLLYKQECGRSNLVDRNHALFIVKVISNKHEFCKEHHTLGLRGGKAQRKAWPFLLIGVFDYNVCRSMFLKTQLKFLINPITNHIGTSQFMSLLALKHQSK